MQLHTAKIIKGMNKDEVYCSLLGVQRSKDNNHRETLLTILSFYKFSVGILWI